MTAAGPLRHGRLTLVPAATVIVVLFGGALVGAIRTSLQPGPAGLLGDTSLAVWRQVLTDPIFADALWFTARTTLLATVVSGLLAVAAAGVLRGRSRVLQGIHGLPILVPHLVVAIVAVLWLGPGGLADRVLGTLPITLVRDRAGLGIVLVYVFKEVPFLTLLVLASWNEEVAARAEAGAVLGAGPIQRLRWVVWPGIRAPLTIGALIVAAFTFGSFEVPLIVGPTYPPMLAVHALRQTQTSILVGQAQAAVTLLVAAGVSLLLAVIAIRQLRHLHE